MKIDPVTLDGGLGKRWWEWPDGLWKKRASVRERRLRATLARHILPLLQGLEALQRKHYPEAQRMLHGKTLHDVENDPVALEFALYLYELALNKDLILTLQGKGKARGAVSIRKTLNAPAGSCGLSPNAVARRYVQLLALPILEAHGHELGDLDSFIPAKAQHRVSSLGGLRTLAGLSRAIVDEMDLGLDGLGKLVHQDKAWLDALATVKVESFLRPLRIILEPHFEQFLEWPTARLKAAAQAMDHPEKIRALGPNVQDITNPATFTALGAWPMGQDKSGRTMCRIAMIKAQVGERTFVALLEGCPHLLKDLGKWPHQKVEIYKPYLAFLTGQAMQLLGNLDAAQQLALLEGLYAKFGPRILRASLPTQDGIKALHGVINELVTMNNSGRQDPDKVRELVKGEYFSAYLRNLNSEQS